MSLPEMPNDPKWALSFCSFHWLSPLLFVVVVLMMVMVEMEELVAEWEASLLLLLLLLLLSRERDETPTKDAIYCSGVESNGKQSCWCWWK